MDDQVLIWNRNVARPLSIKSLSLLINFVICPLLATPADVSLLMQLGVDGVFVGSGIFKSGSPAKRAYAMAQAVTHYDDPKKLAELSEDLGEAMSGPAFRKDMYKNKYN